MRRRVDRGSLCACRALARRSRPVVHALAAGIAAGAVWLGAGRSAWAVETADDVETDHVDARDDGGPRLVGVLVHPLSIATGWIGAELDAACGERVVASIEADGRWFYRIQGYRAAVGLFLYPQRFAFRGLYVHPIFEWERAAADGVVATAVGGAVTVGYAWTWPLGASVRLGGGLAYARTVVENGGSALDLGGGLLGGFEPQVDGDVGWVF